jgi:anti-sigma28 factor (negative regulator of flagellin synthesis)
MDMKVYDRNLTGAAAAGSSRTEDTRKAGGDSSSAASSGRGTSGDQVQLSGTFGRLSQALSVQGSQRAAKVAALTAAYRSGNYQPNAVGTAKGLVSEALSAGGAQPA